MHAIHRLAHVATISSNIDLSAPTLVFSDLAEEMFAHLLYINHNRSTLSPLTGLIQTLHQTSLTMISQSSSTGFSRYVSKA